LFALACNKGGVSKDDLALVPQDTDVVVGVNLARMRGTAMWKKITDLSATNAESKKNMDEFAKACVDVMSNDGPESVFIAMPAVQPGTKDAAVIIRLKKGMDQAKVQSCADYMAGKSHSKVAASDYNGKKIYAEDGNADKGGVVMLDDKTVLFGSGAWIKKVIDIAGGKEKTSAKNNDALASLVKRAKTSDAIWGAGNIPQIVRDGAKGNPMTSSMASLKDAFGSIDFASGLSIDASFDLGSDADAKSLNDQATTQLAAAKKSPQVMMLGMATMLDPIKTEAKGSTFHFNASYNQQQVDDMVGRLQGLLKGFGGGMP
jgi:hypothetical protein